MKKQEPMIVAPGLSNDELLNWMRTKVSASRDLQNALAERLSLQQALVELDSRIEALTNSAALEVCQTTQDPTHHQQW